MSEPGKREDVRTGIRKDGAVDQRETLFSPIKTKRAFEEISGEIKQLIFKGSLKPGDRLPSETELANQFGVGRQTVREALRLLELSGFVGMQKGGAGGPLVVDTVLNTISNSFIDAFQMKRITIDELTAARLEIEKMVLRGVMKSASMADIDVLRQNIARSRKKIENGTQAFDENLDFHRLLAKATRNYVFVILMESITAVVAHFRSSLGSDLKLSAEVIEYHEQLLDAILHKKEKTALNLAETHLLRVDQRLKAFYRQLAVQGEGSP